MTILEMLKYHRLKDGVIPVVIQDYTNQEVLEVYYMDREAVKRTLTNGLVCFCRIPSRKYWVRGETSGHTQTVKSVYIDCYGGSLLIKVDQHVGSCHHGYRSCFYRQVSIDGSSICITASKVFNPIVTYNAEE